MIKVLAIGDVIGKPGRRALELALPKLRQSFIPDLVSINGENIAGGFGMTRKVYDQIVQNLRIDVITMGNHWHDKKEIFQFFEDAPQIVLPANMGNVADERWGLKLFQLSNGTRVAVMNIIGKVNMIEGSRDPFATIDRLFSQIPEGVKIKIVDVHAEATSEKQALGFYLAGRASLVFGTHSHVPTADERILNSYTGFITDLGATGGYDGVIGMKKELVLKRFLSGQKVPLEPAKNDVWLCGVVADICKESGACERIERIKFKVEPES